MHYPVIDSELLYWLRLFHAGYNSVVILLFFYHGTLGLRIRRARKFGSPLPLPAMKRHRNFGPVLAGLGVFGFFIGLTLVMLDTGNVLEHRLHLLTGSFVVLLIIATVILSQKIKAGPAYRTPHFILGVSVLCLYVIEAFFGIGILL